MYRRKPAVAGSFYPSNPDRLSGMIDRYLEETKSTPIKGEVVGIISPHAGYVYSGPVAAYGYRQIAGSGAQLVVVLAPSHRVPVGGASILPEGLFETPLGDVTIDSAVGARLKENPLFRAAKEAHEMEHSLEVQVPFLQRVLKDFAIVPIIVGVVDMLSCRKIAEGIRDALEHEKRKYIVVVSTDLSHYYSYSKAQAMDNLFIEAVRSLDEDKVNGLVQSGRAEACGERPVLAGIILGKLLGATRMEILKYANSGDTAGGKDQVVGYLSAAMVK